MLIGCARVSTEDQHHDLQHDALARAGCERTFKDQRPGAKADRPGLLPPSTTRGTVTASWCGASTINGKLTFHLFAALAEFKRALVRERTRVGLDAARARGRMGGRKHRLTPERRAHTVDLYRAKDKTVREICRLMGISKPTLYAYVSEAETRL
jgi:DNA invertase Pin-like site-specific DNA recombinase